MSQRKYLPTLSELIDRLSIVQLKEVFVTNHKKEYANEIADICHDIDLCIKDSDQPMETMSDLIRAIVVLSQMNLHIWHNEASHLTNGDDSNSLELTHGLNGIRNTAKNKIQEVFGGRKDHKIDCLAEEFKSWQVSWDGPASIENFLMSIDEKKNKKLSTPESIVDGNLVGGPWITTPPEDIRITVQFPTRGRIEVCKEAIIDLMSHAKHPNLIEVHLAVDKDDKEGIKELFEFAKKGPVKNMRIFVFDRKPWAVFYEYGNEMARHANGDWIFVYSDDMLMKSKDWDSAILRHKDLCIISPIVPNNNGVVRKKYKEYCYNPIVPRAWYDALGMIAPDVSPDVWVHTVAKDLEKHEKSMGVSHPPRFYMEKDIHLFSRRHKDSGDKELLDKTWKELDQSRQAHEKNTPNFRKRYKGNGPCATRPAAEKLFQYLKDLGKK